MSKNNLVVNREELAFTMSRILDAPREKVWKAWTEPDQIPHWWGQRSSTTIVDKMDLRVGGEWRYIEKDSEGNEYAFNGVYKKIVPNEHLVYTSEFELMAGHISTESITFEETKDGKTKCTSRTTFESVEDLDGILQSGMEEGTTETWDQLEELVTKA